MFLPAYLLWGIWLGLGAQQTAHWIAPSIGWPTPAAWPSARLAVLAALLVAVNYRLVDASRDCSAREHGEAILATLAPAAVFVGSWADVRLLEYLQYVEGQRRDVELVDTVFRARRHPRRTDRRRHRRRTAGIRQYLPRSPRSRAAVRVRRGLRLPPHRAAAAMTVPPVARISKTPNDVPDRGQKHFAFLRAGLRPILTAW